MTNKRRNLFLYLALACFGGIIALLVMGGCLGIFDTIYITTHGYTSPTTTGQQEIKVEPTFWLRPDYDWAWDPPYVVIEVVANEKVYFRYEQDKRRLSSYAANIEISVWSANMEVSPWRAQERVLSLVSEPIVVAPFGKGQVEGVLDTSKLELGQIPPDQYEYSVKYSVVIKHGEIERKVLLLFIPELRPPLE